MKRLRTLLHKEWRDQRALVLGSLVACLVLLVTAKILGGSRFDPLLRTRWVLPACLAAFALLLAIEGITRDVQNGMERTLLRLPVPRGLAWAAKGLFVVLAWLGLLVLLSLVEVLLRGIEGRPLLPGLTGMLQPAAWLVGAAVAAACSSAASVTRHSLPAAFLGLALVVGVPVLALQWPAGPVRDWLSVMFGAWAPAWAAGCTCIASLLASLLAFRVRNPRASGVRRVVAAALGAGLVGLPALAGTALHAADAFDVEFGSPRAEILWISPSPDGRFLAAQVEQDWALRDDWMALDGGPTGRRTRTRAEVWIFDRSTKTWNEIDGRFRVLYGTGMEWDEQGRLRAGSTESYFGDGEMRAERIDPLAGVVLSSQAASAAEELGRWYQHSVEGRELVVRWKKQRVVLRLPKGTPYQPSSEPGIVFHEQDGLLVRHELLSGAVTRLVALNGSLFLSPRVSPDGRYVFVRDEAGERVVDACDGRVLHAFERHAALIEWSRVPGRIGIWCQAGGEFSVLLEDGTLAPLPARAMRCQELGGEWLLSHGASRIECMKLDGSECEVLYEARP